MKKGIILFLTTAMVFAAGAFAACKDNSDSGNPSQSSSESSSESSVEAVKYTVSFETNGGTAVDSIVVEEGEGIDLGECITSKEDAYFYSWCVDAALENRASNHFVPTADVTLYAEWGEEEKYLLVFETGDGSKIESVLYAPNAYLAKPEDPTLANYVFAGWYKDAEYTREFSFFGNTMPARQMTVYAKWTEAFAIHFDSMGGSEVESLRGEAGEAVSAPKAPVREGYVFEGWFTDRACTKPYTITAIPQKTVTLYAGWHEQQKNISVRLHFNHDIAKDTPVEVAFGNEGEGFEDEDPIKTFLGVFSDALKPYFLDQTVDIVNDPVYDFNGWAYDAEGKQRFNGVLPETGGALDLYAMWARSSAYCQVKFLSTEAEEQLYYVVKNTKIDESVIASIEAPLKEQYNALGCDVNGFYTAAGLRYVSGQKVVMDMELSPYLYSVDVVYEYANVVNAAGNTVKGYVVKGYDPESEIASKDKESLLLTIPEYYNDGEHGDAAVLWIDAQAFMDYPVTELSLPKRLLGIGAEAFKNTKLENVTLPASVYALEEYVFADCTALAAVTLEGSSVTQLGSKIFQNSPYEALILREDGFVFFDQNKTIVYGYEGTASEITTPAQAKIIAGEAFKGNTVVEKLTLHDNVVAVGDSAFEGSAVKEVTFGKSFSDMGDNLFKDCVSLTTVNFTYGYNISYIGTGMFQGCTALESIDMSALVNLQAIHSYAFEGCSKLSEVLLSEDELGASNMSGHFTVVGDYAFANCTSLEEIVFPASLERLGAHCFEKSAIANLNISKALSFVGAYAFADCDNLEGVCISKDVSYTEIEKGLLIDDATFFTTIEEGVFKGCDALQSVILSDNVTEIKASAFEACTKLVDVSFGETEDSMAIAIGDRAFADCTSLKRLVLSGSLKNDTPVAFGDNVFLNAGYTLADGEFRTPALYVKIGMPDFSTESQWKNGNAMYSYAEIYSKAFEGTEYASLAVKPIDNAAPELTLSSLVLSPATGTDLTQIDLLAYFRNIGLYTVTDNASKSEDCDITISSVTYAGEEETEVSAEEGKYDLSVSGTYNVTLVASDECGNTTKKIVQIVIPE